jgi:hypothetical protein
MGVPRFGAMLTPKPSRKYSLRLHVCWSWLEPWMRKIGIHSCSSSELVPNWKKISLGSVGAC